MVLALNTPINIEELKINFFLRQDLVLNSRDHAGWTPDGCCHLGNVCGSKDLLSQVTCAPRPPCQGLLC